MIFILISTILEVLKVIAVTRDNVIVLTIG